MTRRRKIVLTITMVGPKNTGPRPDCHEIVVQEELQVMAESADQAARKLADLLGVEVHTETHHLAQADDGTLWETVGSGEG